MSLRGRLSLGSFVLIFLLPAGAVRAAPGSGADSTAVLDPATDSTAAPDLVPVWSMTIHWDEAPESWVSRRGTALTRTPPALEVTANAFESGKVDVSFPVPYLIAGQFKMGGRHPLDSLQVRFAPILFDSAGVPSVPPLSPYDGLQVRWCGSRLVILGPRPIGSEGAIENIDYFDPADLRDAVLKEGLSAGDDFESRMIPAGGSKDGIVQIEDVTYWYHGDSLVRSICRGAPFFVLRDPTGRSLAVTFDEGRALVVVRDDASSVRYFGFSPKICRLLTMTASGRLCFYVEDEEGDAPREIYLLDPGERDPVAIPVAREGRLSFSDDGNYMLVTACPPGDCDHWGLQYFDVSDPRAPQLVWANAAGDFRHTAVSRTGRYVAAQFQLKNPWRIRTVVYRRDGGEVAERCARAGEHWGLRFLDDRFRLQGEDKWSTKSLQLYDLAEE